jgi:hypothetical protein
MKKRFRVVVGKFAYGKIPFKGNDYSHRPQRGQKPHEHECFMRRQEAFADFGQDFHIRC